MNSVAPGGTLGILGGGQLGRLIAQAACKLRLRTIALDPSADCPASHVVDEFICASVEDVPAALRLASISDVVTLEWELIPAALLSDVANIKPLYPAPTVLSIIQDRLDQKRFLTRHSLPQTAYGPVDADLVGVSFPCIIKRRRAGYDGKGQAVLETLSDAAKATEVLKSQCIWESKVPFIKEISVILARAQDGMVAIYPIAENVHHRGILHTTRAPADISATVAHNAHALAREIAEAFKYVGVMAVEMFVLADHSLLVNEIAPRVHNSGHYTLGACTTSQFEQHVRAVCGLPLGAVTQQTPAVMVNLMGDLWSHGEPNWSKLTAVPGLQLHLYGKSKAQQGRKMGHFVLLGHEPNEALALAERLLADLRA